ncbi:MAG: hypothetical protein KDD47_02625, partial [Acidobacteria bacterium]|nr:hypothetical protein [Acidobacteriota bacterium]
MRSNPRGVRWGTVLLIGLLALLSAISLLYLRIDRQNRALEETWRQSLGGKTFLEAYPPREDNAVVRELKTRAPRLGVLLNLASEPEQVSLSEEARAANRQLHSTIREYVRAMAEAVDGDFAPAPVEVQEFLGVKADELDAIEALLVGPQPAIWELDLTRGYEVQIPNYLGVLQLHRLLLVRAGERIRLGDESSALETLEAAWRLQEGVGNSPVLIAELIRQAMVRTQQPLLRAVCNVPEVWLQRLEELDLLGSTFRSLQAEAWVPFYVSYQPLPLGKEGDDSHLVRAGLRDFARRLQGSLERLREQDLRNLDSEAFMKAEMDRLPRWQYIARMLYPNFLDAWSKAAHLELSVELTRLVWAERQRRAAGAEPLAAVRRPSRIQGLDWIYELSDEGLTIRLDGEMASPGPNPLPTRFQFRVGKERA